MTTPAKALHAALTVLLALLFAAPAASAEVRSGTISFARPADPPAITPQVPQTQQRRYVQAVTVNYDDQTGQLTVHIQVYDAAHWADHLPAGHVRLAEACGDDGSQDGELVGDFDNQSYSGDTVDPPSVRANARVTRPGYAGAIDGTVTPAPDGFTVSYPPAATLAGLGVRCFTYAGYESFYSADHDDADYAYFAGHEPFTLKAENATGWFKQALSGRYGTEWDQASERWALCPDEEFFPDGIDGESAPHAICMAQFKHQGRWRYVSVGVQQGELDPYLDRLWSRTWKRAWKRVGSVCKRRAGVQGTIMTNDGSCPALMIGDLAYDVRKGRKPKRAGWHGTNTAGFQKVVLYRCRTRGRTITCTNGMGDAFRWTLRR